MNADKGGNNWIRFSFALFDLIVLSFDFFLKLSKISSRDNILLSFWSSVMIKYNLVGNFRDKCWIMKEF